MRMFKKIANFDIKKFQEKVEKKNVWKNWEKKLYVNLWHPYEQM